MPETQNTSEQSTKKGMNRTSKALLIGFSCFGVILLLAGCATAAYFLFFSDKSIKDLFNKRDTVELTLDLGTEETLVSGDIGSEGGEVTVTTADSDLNGAKIVVGNGIMDESESISIGSAPINSIDLPENMRVLSDMIILTKTNEEQIFSHPVAVVVPFNISEAQNADMLGVYEYDPDTGRLDATTTMNVDTTNGSVTFLTTHFSYYIIIELIDTLEELLGNGYDTGFDPASDGWFITNWGAYITDGGNCLGMSAMSKYIYAYQQASLNTSFYEDLREGDKSKELDDAIAQELAARNQLSLTNRWNELRKDMDRYEASLGVSLGHSASARTQGKLIMQNLKATGEPQVLYVTQLFTNNTWGAAHAVLAYKYEDGYFYIYDPNYPYRSSDPGASVKKIKFDPDSGFEMYNSSTSAGASGMTFNVIYHLGTSAFTDRRIMAGLWNKALGGFSDEDFPTIEFTAPEPDEVVTEKSIVVTGNVTGGRYQTEAGSKYLHWYYQNEQGGLEYIRSGVEADGSFTQELPVIPGTNWIHVLAAGETPTDEWAAYGKTSIDAAITAADMVVTLTWDRGSSDIDLHVTDPTGDHVWYSDMSAESGAQLDFDNTSGYGPEHYTISSEEGDEMPYGNYSVEVVYYADHDSDYDTVQAVPYNIHMKWVEAVMENGDKMWASATSSGILTSEDERQSAYTITIEEPDMSLYEVVANPFGTE